MLMIATLDLSLLMQLTFSGYVLRSVCRIVGWKTRSTSFTYRTGFKGMLVCFGFLK